MCQLTKRLIAFLPVALHVVLSIALHVPPTVPVTFLSASHDIDRLPFNLRIDQNQSRHDMEPYGMDIKVR